MYTTQSKVEQYLNTDLSAVSSEVLNWIASVEAWINRYCGKTFEGSAETRYYDGNGKRRILIDPFTGTPTEVSVLELDGTTHLTLTNGPAEDYIIYPLNETEKNELALVSTSNIAAFLSGKRRVKVTASFGASTSVPADVELAATKLVGTIAEKRTKGGETKSEKLGDQTISYKDIDEEAEALGIYNILDQHREIHV